MSNPGAPIDVTMEIWADFHASHARRWCAAARLGTQMFLIALAAHELASCDSAAGETKAREAKRKSYFVDTFSQKEEQHDDDTRTQNGLVHLHRQMDTQDFVFVKTQTLSPWTVAPPARKRVTAHADQNSPQSRIRGFNRQACDKFEDHYCRVFIDRAGKNNHRSPQRNVPLGKAIPQGRERGRAASRSRSRVTRKNLPYGTHPITSDADKQIERRRKRVRS